MANTIGEAKYTETKGPLIEMFYSKTDKTKYPDAKQEYRFKKFGE